MAMVGTLQSIVSAGLVRENSELAALGSLGIAGLLDYASTVFGINRIYGGEIHEMNLPAKDVMSELGAWQGLLAWNMMEVFAAYALLKVTENAKNARRVALGGIGALAAWHLGAALHNTVVTLSNNRPYSFAEEAYVNLFGAVNSFTLDAFNSVYSSLASLSGKLF